MKRIYGLDYRSVGLFRIALGLFVIFNMITLKFINFDAFFSISNGFIPTPVKNGYWFTNILTTDFGVILLFAVVMCAAFLMIFGFYSRVCAVLLFLFYAFYNNTFSHLSFGYDRYVEVLLFCSIFLPLDQRFSINTKSNNSQSIYDISYRKWPAFFVILQIALIYSISGFAKNGVMWLNGTAVGVLLSDDLMTLPIATKLSTHLILIKGLSYLTIFFEILAIFLIFSPWKSQQFRLAICIVIMLFHWGLSFFVNVGHFKLIGTVAMILLLPSIFWTYFTKLEIVLNKLSKSVSEKSNLNFFETHKYFKIANLVLGVFLFYGVIISNLKMISEQGDEMGKFMRKYKLDKTAQALYLPKLKNVGTVFNQNWYFYAPNPNIYLGKIYFVGITYDDKLIDLETDAEYLPGNYVGKQSLTDLRRYFNTKLRILINKKKDVNMALDYAQYLVLRWENRHKMYLKKMEGYNYYFSGRRIMEGQPKKISIESFISVDLDKMRRTAINN